MTSAEAQAFKRACTCFGLGRYLYNFAEMWVPLNEYRQPLTLPILPKWAFPEQQEQALTTRSASRAQLPATEPGPIDQNATAKIEGFRRILGDRIYGEILWRVAQAKTADAIPNSQLQTGVAEAMELATCGVHRANALVETIGDTAFISVLDGLRIRSMTTIASLEVLKRLVSELEQMAAKQAA